ncbi:MAG: putative ABC transporter permease [Ruminococcus sp.]|nr:putative ABC transporter permease [Ruminococcus sp.]
MNMFLRLAFLFAVGSMIGWIIEFFYRKFFDPVNVERKWLNPGFLTGPYLPLYGFSLIVLYLLARLEEYVPFDNLLLKRLTLFLVMAVCITAIEYLTGMIFIVKLKIMLWDYSQFWKNYKGVICPLYSFFWVLLSAFYYFCINPYILDALQWLSENLAFSFVVGLYYGVFFMDLGISIRNLVNISEFAYKNQIVVFIDELKEQINALREKDHERPQFFASLRFSDTLHKSLESYRENREKKDKKDFKYLREKLEKRRRK